MYLSTRRFFYAFSVGSGIKGYSAWRRRCGWHRRRNKRCDYNIMTAAGRTVSLCITLPSVRTVDAVELLLMHGLCLAPCLPSAALRFSPRWFWSTTLPIKQSSPVREACGGCSEARAHYPTAPDTTLSWRSFSCRLEVVSGAFSRLRRLKKLELCSLFATFPKIFTFKVLFIL